MLVILSDKILNSSVMLGFDLIIMKEEEKLYKT